MGRRRLGNDALIAITKAVALSTRLLALAIYWHGANTPVIPRSLVFNYWWLNLLLISGLRLVMRQFFMGNWFGPQQTYPNNHPSGSVRVAIYGAGAAGNQLVAACPRVVS